jgi:hypothetical protein
MTLLTSNFMFAGSLRRAVTFPNLGSNFLYGGPEKGYSVQFSHHSMFVLQTVDLWKDLFFLTILFPTCDNEPVCPTLSTLFVISSHWLRSGCFLYPFSLGPKKTFLLTCHYTQPYSWNYIQQTWSWRQHVPQNIGIHQQNYVVWQPKTPQSPSWYIPDMNSMKKHLMTTDNIPRNNQI